MPGSDGDAVPHEGELVFDVLTWKKYHVRETYRLGNRMDVHLQPPGGADPRHLPEDDFVAEIGSRLLLRPVLSSLEDGGNFNSEVGRMAANVFDKLGFPDEVLTCPNCGATVEDGDIKLQYTLEYWDIPDEGPKLTCRDCRNSVWCVRPAVINT